MLSKWQWTGRFFVKWKLSQLGDTLQQDFLTLTLLTFGLDNSLLWEFILCVVGCVAASLGSTHSKPLTPLPLWQSRWRSQAPPVEIQCSTKSGHIVGRKIIVHVIDLGYGICVYSYLNCTLTNALSKSLAIDFSDLKS